jgi:hypothetical protein
MSQLHKLRSALRSCLGWGTSRGEQDAGHSTWSRTAPKDLDSFCTVSNPLLGCNNPFRHNVAAFEALANA